MKSYEIPPFVSIQKTIDEFGYDPREFKGTESRQLLVIRECTICGNSYKQKFDAALRAHKNKKDCKYCANKKRAQENAINHSKWMKENIESGEWIHPMLGKHHSEETKEKLSKFHKGKTLEEKIGKERANKIKKENSNRFKGKKNPFYGKKHSSDSLKKMEKRILSEESLKKIREARKNKSFEEQYGEEKAVLLKENLSKRMRGKNNPAFGKIYNSKKGFKKYKYKNINLRSSYEYFVVKYFDEQKINWLYESTVFELGDTTYTPDFYLPLENKWIEVKGYWYEDAIEKFKLFKEKYPNIVIEIWDKEKLKSLKII